MSNKVLLKPGDVISVQGWQWFDAIIIDHYVRESDVFGKSVAMICICYKTTNGRWQDTTHTISAENYKLIGSLTFEEILTHDDHRVRRLADRYALIHSEPMPQLGDRIYWNYTIGSYDGDGNEYSRTRQTSGIAVKEIDSRELKRVYAYVVIPDDMQVVYPCRELSIKLTDVVKIERISKEELLTHDCPEVRAVGLAKP